MDWVQRFEIIRKKIKVILARENKDDTDKEVATFLETSVSTFRRWKFGTQKPDADSLELIAHKVGVSLDWLVLGRGAASLEAVEPLSATNHYKQYIGEILNEAFGLLRIDCEGAARRTGIDKDTITALLESRLKPNFDQLEAMYRELGINPIGLFGETSYWRVIFRDQLLLVLAAVGYAGREPTDLLLQEIFSIELDEARAFLVKWHDARGNGQNCFLPQDWIENLTREYSLEPGWFVRGDSRIACRKNSKAESDSVEVPNAKADSELMRLMRENLRLHEELEARLKAEIKATQTSTKGENFEVSSVHGTPSAAPLAHGETNQG